jgi:prevent-host-death family protein
MPRSVNIAQLKDRLSHYVGFAKRGEEVIIRERKLPVAKLVPFDSSDATEEELQLVAEGKLRMPQKRLDLDKLRKIPMPKVRGRALLRALLKDREESR